MKKRMSVRCYVYEENNDFQHKRGHYILCRALDDNRFPEGTSVHDIFFQQSLGLFFIDVHLTD